MKYLDIAASVRFDLARQAPCTKFLVILGHAPSGKTAIPYRIQNSFDFDSVTSGGSIVKDIRT